jgi:hypothetical protein
MKIPVWMNQRMNKQSQDILEKQQAKDMDWPPRPEVFSELLRPVEAAQYLRLDETGSHTPKSAVRTLNYWRDRGELKATKFARRVWYRKTELDRFLAVKTED